MGLAALCAVLSALLPTAPAADEVFVAQIRNEIILPVTAQYLVDSIHRADEEHAALLVIELDTPGGLVDSMSEILQAMNAAKTPVAVFVAPSGAHAASAGFYMLISADVAAMAPATNTGSAHPIDLPAAAGSPEKKDDVLLEKIENDLAARARTTAELRRRNTQIADDAVRKSTAYTETECLDQGVIEIVAKDRADLLEKLDGRRIRRLDGSETVLHTRGPVRELGRTFVQSVLGPILRPELVLILLGIGVMGLYVEISHPGMIFPGVIGVLCLLLFGVAFHFLPMNAAGVALVALGLTLFLLELKFTSYGALTIGGFACLLFGLLMVFPRDVPALRVSIGFILPLAIAMAGVMAFFLVLVARAQRTPVATGMQGMVGEAGRAVSDVAAEGKVYVHGETWDARSASPATPVASGADVRVLAVEGTRLVIEKKESIA